MNRRTFLISDRIRLRAMEPEDLDFLYTIENDPGSWDVSGFSEPYSRSCLSGFISACSFDVFADRQMRLVVELRETSQAIGTVDLTDFSPQHRHAEVGIALLSEYRGKGLALEALGLLEDYAFTFLHLKHLLSRVPLTNQVSLSLFERGGYQRSGILHSWWLTPDGYQDVAIYEKVRP